MLRIYYFASLYHSSKVFLYVGNYGFKEIYLSFFLAITIASGKPKHFALRLVLSGNRLAI